LEIIDNKELLRFEYRSNDIIAYLEYKYYKQKNIAFVHTVVPDALKGKGIATALAEFAFKYAKQHKKMVMVYCPFVGAYLKKHPELQQQLNPEFYV
jgi:hypothetical protein